MYKQNGKIKIKDTYWWLGPLGVLFVFLLIIFAMIRGSNPVPLDERVARTRKVIKSKITGRNRTAFWLDMEISPMTKAAAHEFALRPTLKGVVITDIDGGQGATAGMNIGDVIVAVNGTTIKDFDAFLWLARQSKFSDGILLDVVTNGKRRYVSVPFLFSGGPLAGPNANHWQAGSPLYNPAIGYGTLAAFPNNANQNQGQNALGTAPSFMICPSCGHSVPVKGNSTDPHFCPNCGVQMLRNQ